MCRLRRASQAWLQVLSACRCGADVASVGVVLVPSRAAQPQCRPALLRMVCAGLCVLQLGLRPAPGRLASERGAALRRSAQLPHSLGIDRCRCAWFVLAVNPKLGGWPAHAWGSASVMLPWVVRCRRPASVWAGAAAHALCWALRAAAGCAQTTQGCGLLSYCCTWYMLGPVPGRRVHGQRLTPGTVEGRADERLHAGAGQPWHQPVQRRRCRSCQVLLCECP